MSALIGGPLRQLKFGGLTLRPTKDGAHEIEFSGDDWEGSLSPNGTVYREGTSKIGFIKQECSFTDAEFKDFIDLKDGQDRDGTAVTMAGETFSLNCAIEGEHVLSGGKCTVYLSGIVRQQ